MLLKDRIAVVTGSSRGIGRAIAVAMARQGAMVVINAIRSRELAESVVAGINQEGGFAVVGMADISDGQAVERMLTDVRRKLGPIDILVNNAGVDHLASIEDISPNEWNRVLTVNLTGVYNCCRGVIDEMRARQYGKIICISSIGAARGALFGNVHYAASKAGVHGFAMTLARSLAPFAINVNVIAPGPIETEMFKLNISEERRQQVLQQIPLGFIGTPEDIANAAVFLASDWSRFITGAILHVNGGAFMG